MMLNAPVVIPIPSTRTGKRPAAVQAGGTHGSIRRPRGKNCGWAIEPTQTLAGRGSAAGSLVAYVLGITDIDPLQFGLIFERFLNPERVSPPDIDVDFCKDRRGEVLEYVRQKYGERRVSQIVTFNKMNAKSAVRDVGRVIGLSYGEADRLARMIPNGPGQQNISLTDSALANPELRRAIETEPATRQLWDHALLLEGRSRNFGVHAAGIVIGSTRKRKKSSPNIRWGR